MALRKERDRLKEIDSELSRIKKDLLLIDRSLKSLNKVGAVSLPEKEPKTTAKPPSKGKPVKGKKKAEPKKKR